MKRKNRFNGDRFRAALRNLPRKFATQSDRANLFGCSQASMSRLESGQRKPTLSELELLSNITGFSPADFFDREFIDM